MFAVLLRGVVCRRFFCVPSLSSPGAGLLVRGLFGHLFIYLFIFVSSTEPSGLSVTGAFGGLDMEGLWLGCRLGQASRVSERLVVRSQLQSPGPSGT